MSFIKGGFNDRTKKKISLTKINYKKNKLIIHWFIVMVVFVSLVIINGIRMKQPKKKKMNTGIRTNYPTWIKAKVQFEILRML